MLFKSKLISQQLHSRLRKKRTHATWIFIGTIIIFVLVSYTASKIYSIALDETKRNHQLLQKEMANVTAVSINYYLHHLVADLSFLGSSLCIQDFKIENPPLLIDNYFKNSKTSGVISILITSVNGNIIYSCPDTISMSLYTFLKINIPKVFQTKTDNSWQSLILPKINNNSKKNSLIIVIPIRNPFNVVLNDRGSNESLAYLGIIIDIDWLIEKYIVPLNSGANVTAWLMDGHGKLLFHPEHPEMVFRDISEKSPDCSHCHRSFDWQKRMLTTDFAYGEYTVGEEPTKIMSHVPIEFNTERWILVISSNLSDVTRVVRTKFRLFFALIFIILAAVIIVGFLVYSINTKRIHAEEARNLSEQKEMMHQQICHASKLASIGELVDTVVHEINTPVSIILAQTLAMDLEKSHTKNYFFEELKIIKEQSQRISKYTRRLLNYSHNMPFKPKATDLKKLMDECIYLLAHRFKAHKIKVTKNYAPDMPMTIVDQSQIEQVFMNLLNNAIDAIHVHGEIRIDIHHFNGSDNRAGIEILITDNGEGISKDLLVKIFDPFFTTKTPSRGTGLGLSISKAIIQRHNGKIAVESETGRGTKFSIFLPTNNKM